MTRYCKDCTHCRPCVDISSWFGLTDYKWRFAKCARKIWRDESDSLVGPVKVSERLGYCSVERQHGDCGVDAKNWEPAP